MSTFARDAAGLRRHGQGQSIHTELLEPRRLLAVITPTAEAGFTVFSGVGTTAATNALNAFKAAMGGVDNAGDPTQHATGSRRINWDGVLLDGTDFGGKTKTIVANKVVGIPINRFQTRGALFGEVYAVAGDGFTSVNPGVSGQINAFSPHNTFAHFNDVGIETDFIKPSAATTTPVHEASRGFGAIFTDVERSHSSEIEFLNGTTSLGEFFVPPGASGQVEFLGVLFNAPIVTSVEASPGSSPLFFFHNNVHASGEADLSNGGTEDIAAVDDFLYAEPATPKHPFLVSAKEGSTFSGAVARFTSSTTGAQASNFTAHVNWGDGTTTTGTVVASTGGFTVNGSHKYAEEGTFNVSVAIADNAGHTGTGRAIATVGDAALHGTAQTFNATTEKPFTGTIGKFTDDDAAETDPATYSILVDWGDGSTSVGSLQLLSPGHWAVRGTHQYAHTGSFTVKIAVTDVGGAGVGIVSTAHVI